MPRWFLNRRGIVIFTEALPQGKALLLQPPLHLYFDSN
jgi:hypothetical protein